MRETERIKLDVFDMKCLRNMVGVSRMDRVRNEKVRGRPEILRKMSERGDQRVLSWYGNVVGGEEHSLLLYLFSSS